MSAAEAAPRRGSRLDRDAVVHGVALAIACVVAYEAATRLLSAVHSVSETDDLLGGMWSVIATIFVYRTTLPTSESAALARAVATVVAFGLCLAYLLVLPFEPWGLGLLVGLGVIATSAIGRPDDVITTGITITVVMVVAALDPDDAWRQPILRLADTIVGMAVGLAAVEAVARLGGRASGPRRPLGPSVTG